MRLQLQDHHSLRKVVYLTVSSLLILGALSLARSCSQVALAQLVEDPVIVTTPPYTIDLQTTMTMPENGKMVNFTVTGIIYFNGSSSSYATWGTLHISPHDPDAGWLWLKKAAWYVIRPGLLWWFAKHFPEEEKDWKYQGKGTMTVGEGKTVEWTNIEFYAVNETHHIAVQNVVTNFEADKELGFIIGAMPETILMKDIGNGTMSITASVGSVNTEGKVHDSTFVGTMQDTLNPGIRMGVMQATSSMWAHVINENSTQFSAITSTIVDGTLQKRVQIPQEVALGNILNLSVDMTDVSSEILPTEYSVRFERNGSPIVEMNIPVERSTGGQTVIPIDTLDLPSGQYDLIVGTDGWDFATKEIRILDSDLSEVITLSDPEIVDSRGNPLANVEAGSQILIQSEIHNAHSRALPFAFIVSINDENNITQHIAWISSEISLSSDVKAAVSWATPNPGMYDVSILVWDDLDSPVSLTPSKELSVRVS